MLYTLAGVLRQRRRRRPRRPFYCHGLTTQELRTKQKMCEVKSPRAAYEAQGLRVSADATITRPWEDAGGLGPGEWN